MLQHATVEGAHGSRLGIMEYSGILPGLANDRPLRFWAVPDVRNGKVVLATLTPTKTRLHRRVRRQSRICSPLKPRKDAEDQAR